MPNPYKFGGYEYRLTLFHNKEDADQFIEFARENDIPARIRKFRDVWSGGFWTYGIYVPARMGTYGLLEDFEEWRREPTPGDFASDAEFMAKTGRRIRSYRRMK